MAGHHKAAVPETLLDLIVGDEASVELVDDDSRAGNADNVDGSRLLTLGVVAVLVIALVIVLVIVLVGRGDGSAEESDDCVLHCRRLRGGALNGKK